MDAQTRGAVVAALRWLASELQKGEQCRCGERVRLGWAAARASEIATLVVEGRPASGCKGCGGPVQVVRRGRPRKYCERCHPTRRGGHKTPQKAA
jgi:hypothetical protein